MGNKDLIEIRNSLAKLPALQGRYEKLQDAIKEAEKDLQVLLERFNKESKDVEQLKKDSLSVTVLKLLGRFEGKVTKETEEMLNAKMEYDKADGRVKQLYAERDELAARIRELNSKKRIYEAELAKLRERIKNADGEAARKYRELEEEQDSLSRQIAETDEAVRAAKRAIGTAQSARGHLDSAERWATYDVWTKGGIISHMAKYGHIDDAQSDFHRLSYQIRDLQKELSDVNLSFGCNFSGIDSTTRAIDFWFDNIFTDLNVRNRIRDDKQRIHSLITRLNSVVNMLEKNKTAIQNRLREIENLKENLILSESK